jgi:hypothetical protein
MYNYSDIKYIFTMLLVGGIPTILKNDGVRQWGWDDIPYMKWKIIQMVETTNQDISMLLRI